MAEAKAFVRETLEEVSGGSNDMGFDDSDFERCFRSFDADRSGTIERSEMIQFIKRICDL